MKFKGIKIEKWQQFDDVQINFHERLTVLTGANGSGKTTILALLAKHFGWNLHSLATPKRDKLTRTWKWITGFLLPDINDGTGNAIGEITYSDNSKAKLINPNQNSAQYQIEIQNQQNKECNNNMLHIEWPYIGLKMGIKGEIH